jgi:hypothetical protein
VLLLGLEGLAGLRPRQFILEPLDGPMPDTPDSSDMTEPDPESGSETYPPEVTALHHAMRRFRAIVSVDTGVKRLSDYPPTTYSFPHEFGDLPHCLLRRTEGGLPDEAWVYTEFALAPSEAGWLTLEFLAWWVRDSSRSGDQIQMRPMALPPMAPHVQIGSTLKFIIDQFFIVPNGDLSSALCRVKKRADELEGEFDDYAEVLRPLLW